MPFLHNIHSARGRSWHLFEKVPRRSWLYFFSQEETVELSSLTPYKLAEQKDLPGFEKDIKKHICPIMPGFLQNSILLTVQVPVVVLAPRSGDAKRDPVAG